MIKLSTWSQLVLILGKVMENAVMSSSKKNKNDSLLNFDEWMMLAKNYPDVFEVKRREHIELFFESVSEDKHHRLKGLQWRIDQTRKLSHSPMASCIEISNMMWDSVQHLNECQYELVNIALGRGSKNNKPKPVSAVVLPMPTRAQ
jgi:hypothetical protein